jgi:peptidyl-dipeptidase Dcp
MEHWIIDAAVLRGFGVPEALIAAVGEAERYGQGFATVEFVGSALADMLLHRETEPIADPIGFVDAALAARGMPEAIGMRHRLPVFTHVFDGGYASAYYSYLWSEVLDTDAYEAFVEAGRPVRPRSPPPASATRSWRAGTAAIRWSRSSRSAAALPTRRRCCDRATCCPRPPRASAL